MVTTLSVKGGKYKYPLRLSCVCIKKRQIHIQAAHKSRLLRGAQEGWVGDCFRWTVFCLVLIFDGSEQATCSERKETSCTFRIPGFGISFPKCVRISNSRVPQSLTPPAPLTMSLADPSPDLHSQCPSSASQVPQEQGVGMCSANISSAPE